ncbi:28S ribosomal protein S17, mitochondrial-like [Arvicola amphibius]|uniref:28S ribosomal protein S17, mitochondrial-like n=1 Tax=Arvicola amphibius TaxID=1047088 RepID=UPI001C08454E|nr:28S ribosomal protein S17, mitochondrial-like [Arvicola amphibius]
MSVICTFVRAKWVVGKVIGTAMVKTANVRVTRLVLDPYLLKYFNKRKIYFAHDAHQQCSVGNIVLLRALPVARSKHVKYELAEIIFKVGRVIDPITGKPCVGTAYLESPLSSETANPSKTPELKVCFCLKLHEPPVSHGHMVLDKVWLPRWTAELIQRHGQRAVHPREKTHEEKMKA